MRSAKPVERKTPTRPTTKKPRPIPAQFEPTPIWDREFADRYRKIMGR